MRSPGFSTGTAELRLCRVVSSRLRRAKSVGLLSSADYQDRIATSGLQDGWDARPTTHRTARGMV
jgi:hypothetical protein